MNESSTEPGHPITNPLPNATPESAEEADHHSHQKRYDKAHHQRLSHEQPLSARSDAIDLVRNPSIILLRNTPKGRGIFATANIPARTIIDVSPVLIFDPQEYEQYVGKSRVWFYSFTWPIPALPIASGERNVTANDDDEGVLMRQSRTMRTTQALPLGLGAMFNHASASSPAHNVGFMRDVEAEVIRYVTLREVREGEELCICYGEERRLGFADVDAAKQWEAGEEEGQMDGMGGIEGMGEVFD